MPNETLEIATRNARTYDFYRDGFAVSDGPLVDEATLAPLREHCLSVLHGSYETGKAPRANTGGADASKHPPYIEASYPQDSDHTIAKFLRHPTLGPWVAKVTQAARVQVNMLMTMKKYPGDDRKTRVGWHQDRRYLDEFYRSGSSCNLWIALDEVPLSSGPISFIRGSHLWNRAYSSGFFDHDVDEGNFNIPEGEKWEVVEAALPPGWATLHGPATIHGSGRCVGPKARLSILFTIGLSTPGHDLAIDPNHYWGKRMHDLDSCPVLFEAPAGQERPAPDAMYLFDVHPKVIAHA